MRRLLLLLPALALTACELTPEELATYAVSANQVNPVNQQAAQADGNVEISWFLWSAGVDLGYLNGGDAFGNRVRIDGQTRDFYLVDSDNAKGGGTLNCTLQGGQNVYPRYLCTASKYLTPNDGPLLDQRPPGEFVLTYRKLRQRGGVLRTNKTNDVVVYTWETQRGFQVIARVINESTVARDDRVRCELVSKHRSWNRNVRRHVEQFRYRCSKV